MATPLILQCLNFKNGSRQIIFGKSVLKIKRWLWLLQVHLQQLQLLGGAAGDVTVLLTNKPPQVAGSFSLAWLPDLCTGLP
jgi:hypothetical protein